MTAQSPGSARVAQERTSDLFVSTITTLIMLFCAYISPFVSDCQLTRHSLLRRVAVGPSGDTAHRGNPMPSLTPTRCRSERSVRGGVPVCSEADLHFEGHCEVGGMLHSVSDDRGQLVELALGHLEYQFVVHLQQES